MRVFHLGVLIYVFKYWLASHVICFQPMRI